jgi:hypothetical protein
VACYDAAGIGYIDSDRYQARRDALPAMQAAGGLDFQGKVPGFDRSAVRPRQEASGQHALPDGRAEIPVM